MPSFPNDVVEACEKAGQSHVLRFESDLSQEEIDKLSAQIREIDMMSLGSQLDRALNTNFVAGEMSAPAASDTQVESDQWEPVGLDAIRRGEIGVCVLGGGQGTRLGFGGPKGEFPLQLPSKNTIWDIFAQRIHCVKRLAEAAHLPLFIMTSHLNHERIVNWWTERDFLGLPKEDVYFFPQGTLPCVTPEGKMIMESKSSIASAPDGNGGVYQALVKRGILDECDKRGVKAMHVVGIDNSLVKLGDPRWIGYCITADLDCSNKVVWKRDPEEKVGVMAKKPDGSWFIAEYSDLDQERKVLVDESGKLRYGAGNICNHYFTIPFLREVTNNPLPYHIARKKIPTVDDNGNKVTPTENNGIKMEAFIFDTFGVAKNLKLWEVKREDEFAPLKNATGAPDDTPETVVEMINQQSRKWLAAAGAKFEGDGVIEVIAEKSYYGENLGDYAGKTVTAPCVIGSASYKA